MEDVKHSDEDRSKTRDVPSKTKYEDTSKTSAVFEHITVKEEEIKEESKSTAMTDPGVMLDAFLDMVKSLPAPKTAWERKVQAMRRKIQSQLTPEGKQALDRALAFNKKSEEFYAIDLPEQCTRHFCNLKPFIHKLPTSDATTDLEYDRLRTQILSGKPTYTPAQLEQLTYAEDEKHPGCSKGENCIGKQDVLRRDSSVPPETDTKIVFMAREKSGMCVLDEWLEFNCMIFNKRPLLGKAVIPKHTLFAFYKVDTDAAHGGFHQSCLLVPSDTYEGFKLPFPRFKTNLLGLTMDKDTHKLRVDMSRMRSEPSLGLDSVLFFPMSSRSSSASSTSSSSSSSLSSSAKAVASRLQNF